MLKLTSLLIEVNTYTTTPDFSVGIEDIKSWLFERMSDYNRDQEDIDKVLALVDAAKPSLEKYYVSEWKNNIPKIESPDDGEPTSEQKNQLVTASKNWIRKVITDLSPLISKSDKRWLRLGWLASDWEDIYKMVSEILISIENTIMNAQVSDNEKGWVQWMTYYLTEDQEFIEELYDILVD